MEASHACLEKEVWDSLRHIENLDDDFAKLHELVMQLGQKALSVKANLKIPRELKGVEGFAYVQIYETLKLNSVISSIKETRDYAAILKALENTIATVERAQIESNLREFVLEVISEIPHGPKWDEEWTNRELSFMAASFLDGLARAAEDTGVLIPLFNLIIDEYRVNLGDYGILRRASPSERIDFACLRETLKTEGQSTKYVIDTGLPESTELFPVPNRYFRVLESVILALRLLFGGTVGTNCIQAWIQSPQSIDKRIIFTHTVSDYLRPRDGSTILYSSRVDELVELIQLIYELSRDSFYFLALRRYGAALYTLDYGYGDSIVDCVVAFECLFGSRKNRRIHRILEITQPNKTDIARFIETRLPQEFRDIGFRKLLKRCWTARNKILHGESSTLAQKKAKIPLYLLSRVALLFLRYSLLQAAKLGFPDRGSLHAMLDSGYEEDDSFVRLYVPNFSEEETFWLEYNAVRRDLFGYLKKRFTEIEWFQLPADLTESFDEIGGGLVNIWNRMKSHYSSKGRKLKRLSGAFYEALFYHACLRENVVLVEAQQLKFDGFGDYLPPDEVPYSATMPAFEVVPRLFWFEDRGQPRRYAPQLRGDFVQFRSDKDDISIISLIDVKRTRPSDTQLWEAMASVLGGAIFKIAYPKEGVTTPLKMDDWEIQIVCLSCGKWPIVDGVCSRCGKRWV